MPPLLRRRASAAGKLALETAWTALPDASDIPTIFASRHGECSRSVELLDALASQSPLSPAAFSLSVHNASAGLFSIVRKAHANSIAIAAGNSTAEHAVIEACAILADGASQVLLVMADASLPADYHAYRDGDDTPFGWAWLVQAAGTSPAHPTVSLQWGRHDADFSDTVSLAERTDSGGLDVLRFFLNRDASAPLVRLTGRQYWRWTHHA